MSFSPISRFARPLGNPSLGGNSMELFLELILVRLFIFVYNAIRNNFGSVSCSPALAWKHASQVIQMEKFFWIYHEEYLQQLALPYKHWISFWNFFYFYFMFPIALGVIAYIFIWYPEYYQRQRNTFLVMNCLALFVYAMWPLMPPRLLSACDDPYGFSMRSHQFVDTLKIYPLPGKVVSLKVSTMTNQYAAMPSMHVGYATWSA